MAEVVDDKKLEVILHSKLQECLSKEKSDARLKLKEAGISDGRFAEISLDVVDLEIVVKLKPLFSDFKEGKGRESALSNILLVITENLDKFETLETFIWLIKFYSMLEMLTDFPLSCLSEYNILISKISEMNTEEYEFCPITIHIITKALYEEVFELDVNLAFMVNKLARISKLLYYVSISLIFAGLFRLTGREIKMFRIHKQETLINIMDEIRPEVNWEKLDVSRFYTILKLLSSYQNLVILRKMPKELEEEHKCFAAFFHITEDFFECFTKWLYKTKNIIDTIRSRGQRFGSSSTAYIEIHELLELDMINLMECRQRQLLQI